jgi:nicotinamidase-related amidase
VPIDLSELADPAHTAVLTMEMQRGVIGDLASIPTLAKAAASTGIVDATARLLDAARRAGARVVHCTAQFRPDRAGSATNAPLLAVMLRNPGHLVVDSDAAQVMPELDPQPGDVISPRAHGLSPFTGTSLDITLRNLGVRSVVATGVSVNIGVFGLVLEAVNLGYSVVLATDCVTGVPAEYAAAVVDHSLSLMATCARADQLVEIWS